MKAVRTKNHKEFIKLTSKLYDELCDVNLSIVSIEEKIIIHDEFPYFTVMMYKDIKSLMESVQIKVSSIFEKKGKWSFHGIHRCIEKMDIDLSEYTYFLEKSHKHLEEIREFASTTLFKTRNNLAHFIDNKVKRKYTLREFKQHIEYALYLLESLTIICLNEPLPSTDRMLKISCGVLEITEEYKLLKKYLKKQIDED